MRNDLSGRGVNVEAELSGNPGLFFRPDPLQPSVDVDALPSLIGPRRAGFEKITDRLSSHPKPGSDNSLRPSKQSVAPHLPTDTCKIDPEFAAIAEAWPNLPEAVKASILMS